MIYLDWAASAPPDPEIINLMAETALRFPENPSSLHPAGKAARRILEEARERCASVLECRPEQLTFTSGGTEANAIVLSSRLLTQTPGSVLYSPLEHPSVYENISMLRTFGWKTAELKPAPGGQLNSDIIGQALDDFPDTRLIAVMGVSNETGIIGPLDETAAALCSKSNERPVHFHADMVQAAGKITFSLKNLDSASFSAHKIRGPRGIGLLFHRNPQFPALLRGGGQEHGIRPGTENTAGALAMALALEKHARPSEKVAGNSRWLCNELKKRFPEIIRTVPDGRLDSAETNALCVPGILAAAFPPVPGEVLARVLGDSGCAVSVGSACSSNKKKQLPRSLKAMNVPKSVAESLIRISFGDQVTREELERFVSVLEKNLEILLGAMPRSVPINRL